MSNASPDTAMNTDSSGEKGSNGAETSRPPEGDNSTVPKPKRLACMICRKRKLKCDGVKPSCSTCTRLGHSCAYDEVRRKSGPKRGYVKALEERLSKHIASLYPLERHRTDAQGTEQVETLLKTQDPVVTTSADASKGIAVPASNGAKTSEKAAASANFNITDPSIGIASSRDMDRWHFSGDTSPQPPNMDNFDFNSTMNMNNVGNNFTWEMIGLGLDEPLPPQETIDELYGFSKAFCPSRYN